MVVEQNSSGNPPASVSPDHSSLSFVQGVDLQLIASLATSVRQREFAGTASCTCTTDPNILKGSFNVIWIIKFSDKVKWILRTPIIPWTPMLEERLRSDMVVIKLIQSRTTIPIPKIHDFCFTSDNQLGRPYMIMDYAKGTRLKDVWFDPEWFTEDKRHTLFKSLASYISQLRVLQFDAIGSLYYDEISNTHSVGPLIPSYDSILGDSPFIQTGPYNSTHAYLFGEISSRVTSPRAGNSKRASSLLRLFAGFIPDERFNEAPFCICFPGLDLDDIFIDEDGVTLDIVEWSNLFIGPREGSYMSYPRWLLLDWSPFTGWPPESITSRDTKSAERLNIFNAFHSDCAYRNTDISGSAQSDALPQRYLTSTGNEGLSQVITLPSSTPMSRLLLSPGDLLSNLDLYRSEYYSAFQAVDPDAARFTEYSHIFWALKESATSTHWKPHILHKFTQYVFGQKAGSEGRLSASALQRAIEGGRWFKDRTESVP